MYNTLDIQPNHWYEVTASKASDPWLELGAARGDKLLVSLLMCAIADGMTIVRICDATYERNWSHVASGLLIKPKFLARAKRLLDIPVIPEG